MTGYSDIWIFGYLDIWTYGAVIVRSIGGQEPGQISFIDIFGPFAQIFNKRTISYKLGLEQHRLTLRFISRPQEADSDVDEFRPLLVENI